MRGIKDRLYFMRDDVGRNHEEIREINEVKMTQVEMKLDAMQSDMSKNQNDVSKKLKSI